MAYDTQCADLARHFLQDTKLDADTHVPALAEAIQEAVEDYLQAQKSEDDLKDSPEE
jgi:hypothetical protein